MNKLITETDVRKYDVVENFNGEGKGCVQRNIPKWVDWVTQEKRDSWIDKKCQASHKMENPIGTAYNEWINEKWSHFSHMRATFYPTSFVTIYFTPSNVFFFNHNSHFLSSVISHILLHSFQCLFSHFILFYPVSFLTFLSFSIIVSTVFSHMLSHSVQCLFPPCCHIQFIVFSHTFVTFYPMSFPT